MTNDLLQYLKPEHTRVYINSIFQNANDIQPTDQIEIRKIGQVMSGGAMKPFDESIACGMAAQFGTADDWQPLFAEWTCRRLEQAASAGVGAFMAPALLTDRRANDGSVRALVSVCADFDSGNPEEKLRAINQRFGFHPTMVIRSGGVTSEGFSKLHVHWRLAEPCTETWKVAYIREQIALQYGGDVSFKRIPQVIRIPGALYEKNGKYATTEIIEHDEHQEADIWLFEDVLNIDWDNLDAQSMWGQREHQKTDAERQQRLKQLQSEKIHEGGSDTDNRWQRFSEYAGHQIRQARSRMMTVDEAKESVHLWVENNMVPSWDRQRVDNEFKALLQRDKVNNADVWREHVLPPITIQDRGEDRPMQAPKPTDAALSTQEIPVVDPEVFSINTFDVGSLYAGQPAPVPYLIQNLLIDGATHAMVADGGVGKTYLGLELAMRAAAGPEFRGNKFMGFDVVKSCISVVFTVEDGKDDIHRRISALDPHGDLRKAAAGRCFIVPVQDQILGGLTLVERDNKGNLRPSLAWGMMIAKIEECRNSLKASDEPLLVMIDTYSATHHGDENTSTGTNEWFRAASLLRKFNATLWIMHHVKKANPEIEIKTPSDMRNNIRGSIAFANSCRVVYGIWEMPNSDSVMKDLPKEDGALLFNMGLLKNNTGIDWADRTDPRYKEPMITLRRTGSGQLVYDAMIHQHRIDLTVKKKERQQAKGDQLRAAVLHAITWYAENAWPLGERNLTKDRDKYLPSAFHDTKQEDVRKTIINLQKDGTIKEIKIKSRGNSFVIYDIPTGPYATEAQTDRVKETPVLGWQGFTYDDEHGDYVIRQQQPGDALDDPDLAGPSQSRMDFSYDQES